MSLVQKLTIQSYAVKPVYKNTETLYFKNTLHSNKTISTGINLHFDINIYNSNGPLVKMRRISNMITVSFKYMYKPCKNISNDESLMQYRNRLQYI